MVDIKRNNKLIEIRKQLENHVETLKKLLDENREEIYYVQSFYPIKRLISNYADILYKVKYCIKDL